MVTLVQNQEASHKTICSEGLASCWAGRGTTSHVVIQAHGSANKVKALSSLLSPVDSMGTGMPPAKPEVVTSAPQRTMVRIGDIRIEGNRRKLRDMDWFVESIGKWGLLNPITITKDNVLVAGHHRLEACRRLGWTEIPATIVDLDDMHRQLLAIDENLVRSDLTVLERGEGLVRRKAIYEVLHPEAKVGASPGKAGGGKVARTKNATVASFADNTAVSTKLSARTVQEDIQIATKLPPDVRDAVRDMPLADRKRDLLALARLPEDKQREIVVRLKDGRAKTFAGAKRQVCSEPLAERMLSLDDLARLLDGCSEQFSPSKFDFKKEESAKAKDVLTKIKDTWAALTRLSGVVSRVADGKRRKDCRDATGLSDLQSQGTDRGGLW